MYWNQAATVAKSYAVGLNSNIRCIEMQRGINVDEFMAQLNSNIRCIEITIKHFIPSIHSCWIVTLDVLKLYNCKVLIRRGMLNSNIRCIEMPLPVDLLNLLTCWIVTLDVLKLTITIEPLCDILVE